VIWEPFALAVVFGLVVSAGLYFVLMWPSVEDRLEDDPDEPGATTPAPAPLPDSPSPSPSPSPPPAAADPSAGPTESSPPPAPITES
jgi:hypothetical protein